MQLFFIFFLYKSDLGSGINVKTSSADHLDQLLLLGQIKEQEVLRFFRN